MIKIVFLGTAASIATKKRDNTSFAVYINKRDVILVDCPGSIVQKLDKINLDYTKLTKIIITHHHPDHIYGIVSLIHSQFKMTEKITVFSSKPSIEIIKKLIKIFGLGSINYPKVTFVDVFSKKTFLSSKNIKISAFRNKHTQSSFGINIVYKDKNIVYSSDTALTKSVVGLINRNTYLIHDCTASSKFFKKYPSLYKMHTESSQLKRLILQTQPKLTIPVHFLLLEKQELTNIKNELKGSKSLLLPKDYSYLIIR